MLLFLMITAFLLTIFFYSKRAVLDKPFFSFLFFFVDWASIRFGPRVTSVTLLLIDLVEVWATFRGLGFFGEAGFNLRERLLALQLLIANIGIVMLLLAAAIEEQRTARIALEAALRSRDE